MTLPLLQYGTGNVDGESNEPVIIFSITNGGVGPALIKQVTFKYNEQTSGEFFDFLRNCCLTELKQFNSSPPMNLDISQGGYVTSSTHNVILPAQDKLYKGERSSALWSKLNKERRKLSVEICYCSLLDECYVTEQKGVVAAVSACPIEG